MKLHHHIKIGKMLLNKLGDTYKINRKAYLFGTVAPDLNCIYPAHRLNCTEDRFHKRLEIIDNTNINIVKSFELGVITHYICDYFCYAHNIDSIGLMHKRYEKNLYRFFNKHIKEIKFNDEKIESIWNKNKRVVSNKLKNTKENTNIHCDFILEQLKLMNEAYNNDLIRYNKNWIFSINQIEKDMHYTMVVLGNLIDMLLEPPLALAA